MPSIDSVLIAPSADFAARAVAAGRAFLGRRRPAGAGGPGSQPVVIVPMAAQISGIRSAWIEALGGAPELLPRFLTPGHWLLDLPPDGTVTRNAMARLLSVQQALKGNAWLREVLGARSEAGLWGLAQALVGLCDELSETWLPASATTDAQSLSAELEARLEQALKSVYAHLHRRVLGEEAQLVLTFWKLLSTSDDPVPSRMRAFRRLAQTAHAPVVWIAPLPPAALEVQFMEALSARVPVCVVRQAWLHDYPDYPDYPDAADGGLFGARLARVWPECLEAPKADTRDADAVPIAGPADAPQLRIVAAQRFEDEAMAAASQLIDWLNAGSTHLALVAQDRIVARRARALLARAGIPVRDETGWKLSTTRAAAAVMRWFDIAASGAGSDGHGGPDVRVILDWLKSPFVLADQPGHVHLVARFERSLRRIGRSSGWSPLWQAARQADSRAQAADGSAGAPVPASFVATTSDASTADAPTADDRVNAQRSGPAQHLVGRLQMHVRRWNRPQMTLQEWSDLLDSVLDEFGLRRLLVEDDAGRQMLHAIAMMAAGGSVRLSFSEYRALLSHQLETASFREEPARGAVRVTILPLSGARMRRFDGAVMVGCDDRQLPATPQDALFFSDRLRRELGLPDRAARHAQQARDLAELLINNARVACTWQTVGARGEPLRLSGWLLRLQEQQAGHLRLAGGAAPWIEATRAAILLREIERDPRSAPNPASAELVPLRLSANAYKRLRNCPYQFFAARMLGLSELEIQDDELDKREIGEWLHAILNDYHRAMADAGAGMGRDERIELLRRISAQRFDDAIAEDGHAIRFWKRWGDRIDAYVAWQLGSEDGGWRWEDGELAAERQMALEDGTLIVLHGRLDRIDRHADGREAIRDYKLKRNSALKELVKDSSEDCQLPFYALLRGFGLADEAADGPVADEISFVTGYVGLDDEPIEFFELPDAARHSRELARQLRDDLQRLLRGDSLRALGDERACRWCEARGLCRKGHWQEDGR